MMKVFKNRFVLASLLFLALDLAGGFLILAPFLVSVRNVLEKSSLSRELWPIASPNIIADILINQSQMLATAAIAGATIYIVFMLLKTLFSGGIYRIIIEGYAADSFGYSQNSLANFIVNSANMWPGFLKIALFSLLVYGVAIFLGLTLSRVLAVLGSFWQTVVFLFVILIGSTYIQILKLRVSSARDNSLVRALQTTRAPLAGDAVRIIVGNLSVTLAGIFIGLLLWLVIKWLRGYEWNVALAAATVILEQLIVFVFCMVQAIRINFNYSIIKKGAQNAVGGTELGGV
jgi:hypothetical protein